MFGDGTQMRNAIYVEDAVTALIQASQSEAVIGETFFAVSDEHHSVIHIANATVECIGKGNVRSVPWPPGRQAVDVGDAILSNKKFKAVVGWYPKYDLKAGLIKTKEYFESRLSHYLKI